MDKLTGKIIKKADVSGKIGIPYGSNRYTGEYIITPKAFDKTVLETSNKTMLDDVTVKKIPYQETTNLGGGMTVIIAQEE